MSRLLAEHVDSEGTRLVIEADDARLSSGDPCTIITVEVRDEFSDCVLVLAHGDNRWLVEAKAANVLRRLADQVERSTDGTD